jgi:DNA primase
MRFSREFLDKLKENVDLVDLASEYTELYKAGPFLYMGHCPHPKHNDSDASFRINTKTNTWCCYGCHSDKKNKNDGNYGSDCIAFVEWINDGQMSWIDCIKYLADKVGLPLPVEKNEKQYQTNYRLTCKFINDLNQDSYEYLYERDLSDNEIQQWKIGYDKNENRIVFPLMDSYNNVLGFNKRLICKETKGISKKYIHSSDSEIFKKSNYLYGMNDIDKTFDYIILSEGVFDVILARKYGLKNTICALGTSLSENQIDILAKYNKEIIVVYDNDAKGIATMKKVMPLLESKNISARLLILPEGKDLADMSMMMKHGIKDYVINGSMTYGYYNIQNAINDFNRELYNLYSRYNIIFDNIKQEIPESEKNTVEAYINNNVFNKELVNLNNVMR